MRSALVAARLASEITARVVKQVIVTRLKSVVVVAVAALALQGCAMFQGRDPLQVTVLGIEPLESQGLELRMLVKLRGCGTRDECAGKDLRYRRQRCQRHRAAVRQAVITVPVTVSAFRMLGQAFDLMRSVGSGKISYEMKGKLNSSGFNSTHFRTQGEFNLPAS